jgi:3-oxoacyl-[acyl-carrier protein] reductase
MSRFESIKIGETAEIRHVLTEEDIQRFVELTGDDNRLHIDKEFAARTAFKKPVAHGMLGASFISTIIGTKLPGDGALWFSQSLEFIHPARIGDKLRIRATVVNKIPRMNVIEIQTDIFNQNNQKITSGLAKVKIVELQETKPGKKKALPKATALVIGATGGIGHAVCTALAREGFDIAVHYHSQSDAAKKIVKAIEAAGQKAIAVQADITDAEQLKSAIEAANRRLGSIGALINCSTAKISFKKFSDLSWSDFQQHLDVQIKGFFNLAHAVVPLMEAQGYGKIINLTTLATEGTPPAQLLPYITAKYGLNGITKALAVELAPKGIQVNLVSPGMTDTELIVDFPEKARLLVAAQTPLRRLARPEDIAEAICFLASAKANFITGETLRVNGGMMML